jgi:hypothetical protein
VPGFIIFIADCLFPNDRLPAAAIRSGEKPLAQRQPNYGMSPLSASLLPLPFAVP